MSQQFWQSDRTRWCLVWLGLVLFGGLLGGCQEAATPEAEPNIVPVTVALPMERTVYDYEDFTGRTDAVQKVEILARVTGYLDKVCFRDGADVKKGDLLFEIDPRPFQAKYDEAMAQVNLREADLTYRKSELARTSELTTKNAVSRSDYDLSVAAHAQAAAAVAAARAAAQDAKLNLDFTKLSAPIDGEISRTRITQGNLVKADQTLLTTIVSIDPIYVYFDIDEHTILEVRQDVRSGRIKTKDSDVIPVAMGLANETGFPHWGYLDFMENQMDPNTGSIRVRGVFQNPKPALGARVLTPGNFARVRVPLSEMHKALLIPERAMAIGKDQSQKYVLVVDEKNVVQYRVITPGKVEDGLQIIEKGLSPKDRVVVGGIQRVRPDMAVTPKLVDMSEFVVQRAKTSSSKQPSSPQKAAGHQ